MVTQIIDGIYQLKIPIPNSSLKITNIYLVRGDKSCTLIDAGWDSKKSFNSLSQQLAEVGVGFSDISQIIFTHAHYDHYGLAGKIKQLTNAKIYMHHQEREIFITRYAVTQEFLHVIEQRFKTNGVPTPMLTAVNMPIGGFRNPIPAQPDVLLNGGETITSGSFNLKVIWTPGHSPGHICLYEPVHKLLFAGDHVLPVITPNVSLAPNSNGNPLGDYLKSLVILRDLPITLVLPAHETIFNNLSERIDEIVHHHQMRNAEILKALNHNEMTAYQIANLITWIPEGGGIKHSDLMPVAKLVAVSETLAHLRALSVEQKVTSFNRDGIVYYKVI